MLALQQSFSETIQESQKLNREVAGHEAAVSVDLLQRGLGPLYHELTDTFKLREGLWSSIESIDFLGLLGGDFKPGYQDIPSFWGFGIAIPQVPAGLEQRQHEGSQVDLRQFIDCRFAIQDSLSLAWHFSESETESVGAEPRWPLRLLPIALQSNAAGEIHLRDWNGFLWKDEFEGKMSNLSAVFQLLSGRLVYEYDTRLF